MSTKQAELSPVDLSPQTNVVTITDNTSSSMVTNITYVPNSLLVTPGQPSTPPPTISQFENNFTITLIAGRSGDADVATDFTNASGGADHVFAPQGQPLGGTPGKLNFYFAVQIDYDANGDVGSVVVYLGQGSYGSFIDPTNNWWIGGSAVSSIVVGSNNEGSIALADSVSLSGNQDTIIFSD
jgi:hypothetical protein